MNRLRLAAATLSNDCSLSAIISGFIAVLVSFAGPAIVVFQAADSAHLTPAQVGSWIWAIAIGSGVSGLVLSWRFKAPIITAWSTPGAALLVSCLPGLSISEAVGAYIVAAVLMILVGVSGLFETVTKRIPPALAAAMLAGILLRFGLGVFTSAVIDPLLVLAMFATYVVSKRFCPRYAIVLALMLGTAILLITGSFSGFTFHLAAATPLWITPQFTIHACVALAIPLFVVTLASQNVPGVAVLRSAGYNDISPSPLVTTTGVASLLCAPFGAHAINLAAITAAICSGPEAHSDRSKRYVAGIACGLFYIIVGIFGATLATLFLILPKSLVAAVAGMALFGPLMNSIHAAFRAEGSREAALVTFLVTASDVHFLGIGSAFWGLAMGLICTPILRSPAVVEASGVSEPQPMVAREEASPTHMAMQSR